MLILYDVEQWADEHYPYEFRWAKWDTIPNAARDMEIYVTMPPKFSKLDFDLDLPTLPRYTHDWNVNQRAGLGWRKDLKFCRDYYPDD